MIKHGLALIFCAILAGCGGGGGDATQPSTPQPTCQRPIKIQLFGDSTQWGYLAEGGGIRAPLYPELVLQWDMDQRFGLGVVIVSTRAVSGTTSGHLIAGTDGLNLPWPKSVDADIVVINHGINDIAFKVPAEVYADHLRTFLSAPAKVVFETPLPVSTATIDYADIMRQVAAETGTQLIDARAYVQSLPDWWQYATDGVHATGQGYELIAHNSLFPGLAPIVEKLRSECK